MSSFGAVAQLAARGSRELCLGRGGPPCVGSRALVWQDAKSSPSGCAVWGAPTPQGCEREQAHRKIRCFEREGTKPLAALELDLLRVRSAYCSNAQNKIAGFEGVGCKLWSGAAGERHSDQELPEARADYKNKIKNFGCARREPWSGERNKTKMPETCTESQYNVRDFGSVRYKPWAGEQLQLRVPARG